jgi:hypothetical protein
MNLNIREQKLLKFVYYLVGIAVIIGALTIRSVPEWKRQNASLDQTVLIIDLYTNRGLYRAKFVKGTAACIENLMKFKNVPSINFGDRWIYVDTIIRYEVVSFVGRSHFRCSSPINGELLNK